LFQFLAALARAVAEAGAQGQLTPHARHLTLPMRLWETQKDVLANRLTSEAEKIQRMTAEEFIEVDLLPKATYAEAEQVVEELKSVVARASIAGLPRSRWFQSNFFSSFGANNGRYSPRLQRNT